MGSKPLIKIAGNAYVALILDRDAPEMGGGGGDLSCPGSTVVANSDVDATRFETPDVLETRGHDLILSFRFQSLTAESKERDAPVKTDGT
jgi:hypothetical protein